MELQQIVDRVARGIEAVDAADQTLRFNQRTGEAYLPGAKSLIESQLTDALDAWWAATHPDDFPTKSDHATGVAYPTLARTKCDFVFTSQSSSASPEWAIEVKNVVLIGNNGKRNDFAVAKVLSPFLKDRSLLHDVLRLRENPLAARHAAIGYAFEYDVETCIQARTLHPNSQIEIDNIEEVCRTNGGSLSVEPLLDFADGIMRVRNLISGPMCLSRFEAWRHPCGGRGLVFGWEVRRPREDGTFDPRHPW